MTSGSTPRTGRGRPITGIGNADSRNAVPETKNEWCYTQGTFCVGKTPRGGRNAVTSAALDKAVHGERNDQDDFCDAGAGGRPSGWFREGANVRSEPPGVHARFRRAGGRTNGLHIHVAGPVRCFRVRSTRDVSGQSLFCAEVGSASALARVSGRIWCTTRIKQRRPDGVGYGPGKPTKQPTNLIWRRP
jgi:hypothetical protein